MQCVGCVVIAAHVTSVHVVARDSITGLLHGEAQAQHRIWTIVAMNTFRQALVDWLNSPDSGVELKGQVFEAARQNLKRPAYLSFFVPDEWSRNISGNPKLTDTYLVLKIPRELLDELDSDNKKEDNTIAEEVSSEQSSTD